MKVQFAIRVQMINIMPQTHSDILGAHQQMNMECETDHQHLCW